MFLIKIKKSALAFLLLFVLFIVNVAKAQNSVIPSAVPFLQVAADARSASMGDQGVATSVDVFSQQWNPAKFAFATEERGFSVSYTPYLSDIIKDVSLSQLSFYNKVNDRSAFALSLRYFGLGDVALRQTGSENEAALIVSPNEFAFDGSYSLKLNERFAIGVAGRYILSSLKVATEVADATAASSFAFDVAGFYQSEEIAYNDFNGRWRLGFNFQNLGPKINYDNDEFGSEFLPANLKTGIGFDFILDSYNKFALNLELNKLLVPTPQNPDLNNDGVVSTEERAQNRDNYRAIDWRSGIFESFGDAPGGFTEEVKEITYAIGAEYSYLDSFVMRMGYFHENDLKGARKFFSLGSGFKYNVVKVDISYLFSVAKVKNPLESTLRFSLTFNLGDTM